jgi:hypothetical protein
MVRTWCTTLDLGDVIDRDVFLAKASLSKGDESRKNDKSVHFFRL